MITEIRKNLGFLALIAVLIYGAHIISQKLGKGGLGR